MRQDLCDHLGKQLSGRLLDALGADHERLIGAHMRGKLIGDGADLLRRCHHQHEVAGGDFVELGGGLDGWIERDPRQVKRVSMLLVDLGDGLGLVGPKHHVAAGAARADRKRRTPGASPDNADALQGHVTYHSCHGGWELPPYARFHHARAKGE